jgi:hypothetical protein
MRGSAILALALIASGAGALGGSVISASARDATALAVTHCPTSYGGGNPTPPKIPRRLVVPSARLAFYSNGWITVLAPRGWHCSGGVGSDGNLSLSVLPPYVSQVTPQAAAVTASRDSSGQAASDACPFFPEFDYPGLPCTKIPARERVTRLTARSVAFEDPPRVTGDGWPSGGPYPANGVVIARESKSQGAGANKETCTLPQSEHALCAAILSDFRRRYRI